MSKIKITGDGKLATQSNSARIEFQGPWGQETEVILRNEKGGLVSVFFKRPNIADRSIFSAKNIDFNPQFPSPKPLKSWESMFLSLFKKGEDIDFGPLILETCWEDFDDILPEDWLTPLKEEPKEFLESAGNEDLEDFLGLFPQNKGFILVPGVLKEKERVYIRKGCFSLPAIPDPFQENVPAPHRWLCGVTEKNRDRFLSLRNRISDLEREIRNPVRVSELTF